MSTPNVLLVVLDAVRADHISCYGHSRTTSPTIDKLAADGVRFENAFSVSNWTGAAHGSLFTGYLPSQSGIYGGSQELPKNLPTIAELLSDAGYRTFATSAGAHIRSSRGYDRGFDEFQETFRIRPNRNYIKKFITEPPLQKQTWQSLVRGHDNYTKYKLKSLKNWINKNTKPFFAFINSKTPHHRYNPPRPYKSMFGSEIDRPRWEFIERIKRRLNGEPQSIDDFDMSRLVAMSRRYPSIADAFDPTKEEWEIIKTWYDGAIRYVDDQLADLFSFLRSTDKMDDTLVIVTADHGELFGEHGLEKHQYSLLDKLLHVPLVINPPSDTRGVVSNMVSLVDLFPTILDIANIKSYERPNAITLAPLEDRKFHKYVFSEVGRKSPEPIQRDYPSFTDSEYNGPLQSVRDDKYKLICDSNGTKRLYNWKVDTNEVTDLCTKKPDVVDCLERILQKQVNPMDDHTLDDDVDNEQLKKHLEHLGYR